MDKKLFEFNILSYVIKGHKGVYTVNGIDKVPYYEFHIYERHHDVLNNEYFSEVTKYTEKEKLHNLLIETIKELAEKSVS